MSLRYSLIPVWSLIVMCSAELTVAEPDRKPNVILIFTDDQGSIDLNCYGAQDLATPNLDRLASEGVRFTQFYAAAPVCSPSRAGVLTGRVPPRAGVPGNVSSAKGNAGMPTTEITVAEMMKAAGYKTGHVGKWHLGYTPETMPNGQGFDESFGHMGGCIDNYSHFFYWNGPNRHDLWRNGKEIWSDGSYFPDLMVSECEKFVEKHRDEPFFLYWALNIPHYPLQGTAKWREHYKDLPAPRRMYNALVSTLDENIGSVMKKLDELGLRENTIVIFQSDHGHSTEVRTFSGGGNSGPYRGAKFSMFEGGIRVPAMISWKGKLPSNQVRDQVAHSCDWLPTIAELCQVPLPKKQLDGISIVPVIHSNTAKSPHKVTYWMTGNQWAVREGDWKLIGNPRDTSKPGPVPKLDRLFLGNLATDVSEKTNLAADHPDVVQRLEKLHREWKQGLQEKN